jgi:Na+/H+ antiporter NhaA
MLREARRTVPLAERLAHDLHPVSAFVVVPLFALANAGIGFTVPLFVPDLAFPDGQFQAPVKLGLLLASVIAGAAGALVLLRSGRRFRPRAG